MRLAAKREARREDEIGRHAPRTRRMKKRCTSGHVNGSRVFLLLSASSGGGALGDF